MEAPTTGPLTVRASMGYVLDRINSYSQVQRAHQYASQRYIDLKRRWDDSRVREFILLEIVPYTMDQSVAATLLFFSVIPIILVLSGFFAVLGSTAFGFTLIQLSMAAFGVIVLCLIAAIPLIFLAAIVMVFYRAYMYYRSLVTKVVLNFHILYHYYAALYMPKIIRDITGL